MSRQLPSTDDVSALRVHLVAAEFKQRVGERIREARETTINPQTGRTWTQRELANALPGKVEGASVSRWERGKVLPQHDTLEAIARALDRDLASFFVAGDGGTPAADGGGQLQRVEGLLAELVERVGALETALTSVTQDQEARRALLLLARAADRLAPDAETRAEPSPARSGRRAPREGAGPTSR